MFIRGTYLPQNNILSDGI